MKEKIKLVLLENKINKDKEKKLLKKLKKLFEISNKKEWTKLKKEYKKFDLWLINNIEYKLLKLLKKELTVSDKFL